MPFEDVLFNLFFSPQFGTNSFGASAHYTHRFSSKSHGRIAGRVGRYVPVILMSLMSAYTMCILYEFVISGTFLSNFCPAAPPLILKLEEGDGYQNLVL
jgi:hypothetical protein